MVREHGGDGEIAVPPTIHALLQARIDSLDGDVRVVMERGSVEGEVFHRGAVAELSPDPVRPDVESHLATLVRKELIRSTSPTFPEDEGFRFRHLLIRDAAYESLPKATRAELHERFADWLATHDLVEGDEIVGYHLEQAHRYRAELDPQDPTLAATRRARGGASRGGRAGAMDRGDWGAAQLCSERRDSCSPQATTRRSTLALELAPRCRSPATSMRRDMAAAQEAARIGRSQADASIAARSSRRSTSGLRRPRRSSVGSRELEARRLVLCSRQSATTTGSRATGGASESTTWWLRAARDAAAASEERGVTSCGARGRTALRRSSCTHPARAYVLGPDAGCRGDSTRARARCASAASRSTLRKRGRSAALGACSCDAGRLRRGTRARCMPRDAFCGARASSSAAAAVRMRGGVHRAPRGRRPARRSECSAKASRSSTGLGDRVLRSDGCGRPRVDSCTAGSLTTRLRELARRGARAPRSRATSSTSSSSMRSKRASSRTAGAVDEAEAAARDAVWSSPRRTDLLQMRGHARAACSPRCSRSRNGRTRRARDGGSGASPSTTRRATSRAARARDAASHASASRSRDRRRRTLLTSSDGDRVPPGGDRAPRRVRAEVRQGRAHVRRRAPRFRPSRTSSRTTSRRSRG